VARLIWDGGSILFFTISHHHPQQLLPQLNLVVFHVLFTWVSHQPHFDSCK